jgi:hypothetical protein
LGALIHQARTLATRIATDPDRKASCHFCGWPVPLWESLLVMQLAGVPAHVQCPEAALRSKLLEFAPSESFNYEEFSTAVDTLMKREHPTSLAGAITCA